MIENNTTALLSLALDGAGMRQKAIAQNIANANTPEYHPIGVDFEQTLANARNAVQQGTVAKAGDLAAFRSSFEFVEAVGMGSGTVALDIEVAKLSENTLYQQTLLKALNRHMSLIGSAINEGKR